MSAVKPKLDVVIINYNNDVYLKKCIPGVLGQTYENLELIFIDNCSEEKEGLENMHKEYDGNSRVTILANTSNKGYARAANQGIRMAIGRGAKYVAIANPDLVFTQNYFEKLIEKMEEDPKIAAITGKIYKYDYKNDRPTDIIDTVGLFAYKNRRVIDDGQGLIDKGQFEQEGEVFGVSGACPLYRVEALEDVKIMDEYFDEDFFMYKEDVDLSWRFLLYGWKNFYCPLAVAYHGRGTGVNKRFFTTEIIKNRKNLTHFQKKLSFKNQHLMELKNEMFGNLCKDCYCVIPRKIAMICYMTVAEPYLWFSAFQFLKQLPRTLKKRKLIMKSRRVAPAQMRNWFKKQSKYIAS